MTFGKATPKGEGMRVEEYGPPLTDKQLLEQAQQYIKSLRKNIDNLEGDAMRYRRLRQLEVVIMAEDGAKYLKGYDLDEYIDELPMHNKPVTRFEIIKEITPALNKLFGEEYDKYESERLEELEKIASEGAFNDKA